MVTLGDIRQMKNTRSPLETITSLQDSGLIARSLIRSVCNVPMLLTSRTQLTDKYSWGCRGCRGLQSVRTGSWKDNGCLVVWNVVRIGVF